jgi:hypothetical protein
MKGIHVEGQIINFSLNLSRKACLHFNRFSGRSLEKVRKAYGIVMTALNMLKPAAMARRKATYIQNNTQQNF